MEYEVGCFYDFQFKECYIGDDGNTYLRLIDPNNPDFLISVKPYDFQIDWDNFFFQNVKCYCKRGGILGYYEFELARYEMLQYLYKSELGQYKTFFIKRNKTIDNKICCHIEDAYGYSQNYYPKDNKFWDKHQVGDEIQLYLIGIHESAEGKNNAYLLLKDPEAENVVSLGIEDGHKEFKASIAFTQEGERNMAEQMNELAKAIAGFMNKDGGSLYIGVNDAGEPYKDISEEFQYLNDEAEDKYKYKANEDKYKLKLHNAIKRRLGRYARTLENIYFPEANGVKYAEIKVERSDRPMWFNKTEFYVRCDNSTELMLDEGIHTYIFSRFKSKEAKEIINRPDETPETAVSQTNAESVEIKKEETTPEENEWRYISFFKNGEWSFRKTTYPKEEELLAEVAIPCNPQSYVLMIAYLSGKINAVALKDLLYSTGAKKDTLIACDTIRKNGVSSTDDRVVSIFCMKTGGIVLMESIANDETFIKAHDMDVVTTHKSLNAQGNKMLPEGKLIRISPIEHDTAEMNSVMEMGLLVKDYERYHKNGVVRWNIPGKDLQLLDSLLKKSAMNLKGEFAKINDSINPCSNYFAIEVANLSRRADWFEQLREVLRNVRVKWQRDVYHITMSFIQGDPDYISEYVGNIQNELKQYHVQTLKFDKLGVFTTESGWHIIYLEASRPTGNFRNMVNMIREQVGKYPVKQSDLKLHVTLGQVDARTISLDELQRLVSRIHLRSFILKLPRVYHRYKGSGKDNYSWNLR